VLKVSCLQWLLNYSFLSFFGHPSNLLSKHLSINYFTKPVAVRVLLS
jgi:hypothetical protein